MKTLILLLSIFFLLLFGIWGCPENPDQSRTESGRAAESVEVKTTDTGGTTQQAGTVKTHEVAMEKAKEVIEEIQVTPQSSTDETTGSE